ncbi:MAG TPA: DNA repair protein RecN [Geminicoccaceae bacterium]|nr:DNA repair protein RecN [Geminicoccus sp.]HMU50736.1 DNA repair protein RecN [Geminicoccaceae bacterium]
MLERLAIRDIVLIDRLDLALGDGLSVLTGETGAGKSIVLDALGLALGARADRGLVRAGAEQGTVTASFAIGEAGALRALLDEHGLDGGDELVLRRVLGADGRGRAFVNDQPVGAGLLRQIGDALVEVHGQMEQQSLLAPSSHRRLLDAFGDYEPLLAAVRRGCAAWREARERLESLQAAVDAAERDIDYLRHRERELADLAAVVGEEEELAERRSRLQHRKRLVEALAETLKSLGGSGGAVEKLAQAQRRIERAAGIDDDLLGPAAEAVARAVVEAGEAEAAVERAARALAEDDGGLEQVEERLFALRGAARKHRVSVDGLPGLLEETRSQLAGMDAASGELDQARKALVEREGRFRDAVAALSKARQAAAGEMEAAIAAELPPLRLERARFRVGLQPLERDDHGAEGGERVQFEVATNPGQPFGPLTKLASGGELSRFMLALKVVLARLDAAETLVFDEVDSGIGGATADAVGERLARLGAERQVLVVTHAPQVAARARRHFRVSKSAEGARATVRVDELSAEERREEIARMLAGAAITDAAREAAVSLLREAG